MAELVEPPRPPSSYWIWLSEVRTQLTQELGTARGSKVSTYAGKKWKAMSQDAKKPFEAKAAELKEAWKRSMETFLDAGGVKGKRRREKAEAKRVKREGAVVKGELKDEDGEAPSAKRERAESGGGPPRAPLADYSSEELLEEIRRRLQRSDEAAARRSGEAAERRAGGGGGDGPELDFKVEWKDTAKRAWLWIQSEGVGEATDDDVSVERRERAVTLRVSSGGGGPKRLTIRNLYAEVSAAKTKESSDGDTLIVSLKKVQPQPWPTLYADSDGHAVRRR